MKIIGFLLILLTMYSCTGLPQNTDIDNIWSSMSGESTPLEQESIVLTATDATGLLQVISQNLRSGKTKSYSERYNGRNFEVYVGDYLIIPLKAEDDFKLLSYPKNISYELGIKGTNLVFRSIYQGDFEVELSSLGGITRRITISNKLKYRFTEQNNYDIILKNYAMSNLKLLQDSVALHRIAFPDSFRDKEISFMLMEVASKAGNNRIVKEELNFLKKFGNLDEHDKLSIIDALSSSGEKNIKLDSMMLEFNEENSILNETLKNIITTKSIANKDEIEFLEKYFKTTPSKELAEFIGNWYLKNGNINKGNQYINGTIEGVSPEILGGIFGIFAPNDGTMENAMENIENQNYTQFKNFLSNGESSYNNGNYVEALVHFQRASEINKDYEESNQLYYYIGQSSIQVENYKKAVENFKKALSLEKSNDKKAEIYYNMAIAYANLGNKEEARNYFTYVRQNYPNTSWSTKSSIYLLKLK